MITVLTTDAQLTIQSWDRTLADWTAIPASQAQGRPLPEMIPNWDNRHLAPIFQQVLTLGTTLVLDPAEHPYLIPCWPDPPPAQHPPMAHRVTIAPLYHGHQIVGTTITLAAVPPPTLTPGAIAPRIPYAAPPGLPTALAEQLPHIDWQQRSDAVTQLIHSDQADLTEELVGLMRREHHNPNLLNTILQTLAKSQIDPLPALLSGLEDAQPEVRMYSVLALGERGDRRAIAPLIACLSDRDVNVCYHAIEALGHLQALEAMPALVSLATSDDFFLAFPALQTLITLCALAHHAPLPPAQGSSSLPQQLLPLLRKTLHWQVRQEAVDQVALHQDPELLPELIQLLRCHHDNPNILNSVLQILTLSQLDPVPLLIPCLSDRDPNVRIYTALALGERGDQRAVDPLLGCLADPDLNVRYHAIEALGQLADPLAVDALTDIAVTEDFFLAFPALEALTRIGDPSVAPYLVPLLQLPLLLGTVVNALGNFGDSLVMRPLVRCLNRDESAAVEEVVLAIEKIYHRYQAHYNEGDYIIELTVTTLNRVGRANVIAAAHRVQGRTLQAVTRLVGWLPGEEIDRLLVSFLPRSQTRDLVVEAIRQRGQRLGPLLVEQLGTWTQETLYAAVTLLGKMGYQPAVPVLLPLLTGETDLVMAVTMALAQIGDRTAFTALLDLLGHETGAVRLGAITALNSLGHPHLATALLPRFAAKNPVVREAAVKIAGYFAFPNCHAALFAATQDPDLTVRRAAILHLPYFETGSVLPLLTAALQDQEPVIRTAAVRALGELDEPATLPLLITALEDPDPQTRYHTTHAIGKLAPLLTMTDRSALLARVLGMARTDPDPQVQGGAVALMGLLNHAEAIPLLIELTAHPVEDVARGAIAALGSLAHPDAIAPLLALLHSANPDRCLAAIHALRSRGGPEATGGLHWLVTTATDAAIVQAAMQSLVQIGTPTAIAPLLDLTAQPRQREACCHALTHAHHPRDRAEFQDYVDAIALGLHHAQFRVRAATIDILTRLKHPHASQYLIDTLQHPEEALRLAAVRALITLGQFPPPSARHHLSQDPSLLIRQTMQAHLRHS
jgi:HEAT repeat protein